MIPETPKASAAEKPCALYKTHAPVVVRTQGHHRHPVYLQNQAYGRIQDPELMWLCGSCHDSVHSWINYLLGEWQEPNPHPGRNVKAEAQRAVDWFTAATT